MADHKFDLLCRCEPFLTSRRTRSRRKLRVLSTRARWVGDSPARFCVQRCGAWSTFMAAKWCQMPKPPTDQNLAADQTACSCDGLRRWSTQKTGIPLSSAPPEAGLGASGSGRGSRPNRIYHPNPPVSSEIAGYIPEKTASWRRNRLRFRRPLHGAPLHAVGGKPMRAY